MIEVKALVTPLTKVAKVLVVVERELLVITVVVARDPPKLEVRVLPVAVKVLLVFKLVTERLVVVALVAVKLVKKPLTALKSVENKFVVVALIAVKLFATVFPDNIKLFNSLILTVVVTPLIALVKVLFAVLKLVVLELMITALEITPFTLVVKVLRSEVI